jgi:hypothetical protein
MAPPSVLVLAPDGAGEGLVEALGADRADATHALLVARARAWAAGGFGPERVSVVPERSFGAALAARPELVAGDGPVVLVAPELPAWPPELAADLLGDLDAGCAAALGPIFDGGVYVLALTDPGVASASASTSGSGSGETLAELGLAGRHAMASLFGLAERERWDVGLLRPERALRRGEDVRALLADPATDAELRGLLK